MQKITSATFFNSLNLFDKKDKHEWRTNGIFIQLLYPTNPPINSQTLSFLILSTSYLPILIYEYLTHSIYEDLNPIYEYLKPIYQYLNLIYDNLNAIYDDLNINLSTKT